MKIYQKPIVEVELLKGISMLMDNITSPGGNIQGNPSGDTNNPGGFGNNAPERRVY